MTTLLALILAPFILLTLCFAVELFAGLAPLRSPMAAADIEVSTVIVVPAHDEEAMIGATLEQLSSAAAGIARILVVADNCTDSTAAAAGRAGAEVIERNDAERRGKGFALDFARCHLASAAPEVVVIVDADCRIDGQSLKRLVATCASIHRPCQATYLLHPAPGASTAVQLSTFAFYVRNVVRQRALQRLTNRVHLLGTGMALPWAVFDRDDLATADIVEDLKMGIELAAAGSPALLVECAEVWSPPESAANTLVQRSRWEGGFLGHAMTSGPRMLALSILHLDARGIWAALDLMIPPLALLVMLDLLALAAGGLLAWLEGAGVWPIATLACSLALASVGIALAWATGGSRFISAAGLARIPLYLVWKLPLYLGLARRGVPKEWLRTRGGGGA